MKSLRHRRALFWTSKLPGWLPLTLVLAAALLLRLALWDRLPRTGLISDEGEYLAAATWLAQGRGFSWHQGWLWTRAPLYPLFLAAHIRIFGLDLTPVYLTQTLMSLGQVVLVYALARAVVPASTNTLVPLLAALLTALCFPLAVYTQVLLSESLYILLMLSAFLALAWWAGAADRNQHAPGPAALRLLALAGVLLGLATLTRGVTVGFVPLVALWIWQRAAGKQRLKQRAAAFCVFACSFCITLLPWSFYASRLYGGAVVVDTTGAYNLLLGARTAYDGDRKDAPARNFVLALLDPQLTTDARRALLEEQRADDGRLLLGGACLLRENDPRLLAALGRPVAEITQGQRQQLMVAEGLCLLRAAPGAFVAKSLAELIDFLRINYTGDERFTDGFTTGRLHPAYVLGLFLLDDTLYLLALPLALVGWALARRETENNLASHSLLSASSLIALWWLYSLLTAPLLFAINRFRVPLLPLLFIFAAYGIFELRRGGWRQLGRRRLPHLALALLLVWVAAVPASWLSSYDPLKQSYGITESYLGPYPSSIASTGIALAARPQGQRAALLAGVLGAGDAPGAAALVASDDLPAPTQALARPLLAGLAGHPDAGLALLPNGPELVDDALWRSLPVSEWGNLWRARASVVRGELLRRKGDFAGARAAFTPVFVDNQNPVPWAWEWLHPPPLPDGRIDLGGNLDLGYIEGFYLGQGDGRGQPTFRWSGPQARLRFPGAGSATQQQFCLKADGRGWLDDLPTPNFSVLLGEQLVATLKLERDVREYCATLPPGTPGTDVVVTLRTPVFVPAAADLLAQQGAQAGRLRLLGLRLDWAELR